MDWHRGALKQGGTPMSLSVMFREADCIFKAALCYHCVSTVASARIGCQASGLSSPWRGLILCRVLERLLWDNRKKGCFCKNVMHSPRDFQQMLYRNLEGSNSHQGRAMGCCMESSWSILSLNRWPEGWDACALSSTSAQNLLIFRSEHGSRCHSPV